MITQTGADGKFYAFDNYTAQGTGRAPRLLRYDPSETYVSGVSGQTNTLFTTLVGGGAAGLPRCRDGDDAATCTLNAQDFFIDRFGVPYLLAQGEVFVLSTDNKLVRIFGQGYDVGRTGPSLNVRFGNIASADKWRDVDGRDRIVTVDALALRIEESILANGVVNVDDAIEGTTVHLAGNGDLKAFGTYSPTGYVQTLPASGVPAATDLPTMISPTTSIAVDPASGFVYADFDQVDVGFSMPRLRRDTSVPKWEIFAGNGTTPYNTIGPTAVSGAPSRTVQLGGALSIWGFASGALLVAMNTPTQTDYLDGYLVSIDADTTLGASNVMTRYSGDLGSFANRSCLTGSASEPLSSSDPIPKEDCHLGLVYEPASVKMVHHSGFSVGATTFEAGWLIGDGIAYNVPDLNGAFVKRVMTPLGLGAGIALRIAGDGPHLFTCNKFTGALFDMNLTAQTFVELAHTFPLLNGERTLKCTGSELQWDATRSALRFSYVRNGLHGIAEYYLP
jgi:hypothetical protein